MAITGQVWSQLVASGPYFTDMKNPKPMIQVGKPGDTGSVEISDMLFTSIGPLPGLILMEWNIKGTSPGQVGMWDSHFRIGTVHFPLTDGLCHYAKENQVALMEPNSRLPIVLQISLYKATALLLV